jgi:hypothetical protein
VLLSDVYYIVKDINYLSLLRVEHIAINKEFVLNLDLLVLKRGGRAIYKELRVL